MLASLKKSPLFRYREAAQCADASNLIMQNKHAINFAGNDYLNIAHDPKVKQAFIKAVKQYGLGSTSSPSICGYSKAHQQLEEICAEHTNQEKALLFSSGYHANLACLSSLANRHKLILADKRIHASLIDGAQLSRAKLFRFNNHETLENKAIETKTQAMLIVSESVFSMDGSITDINSLTRIKAHHNSLLIIDDSHGFGISNSNKNKKIDVISFGLGKAAASMGGILAGSKQLIETIHQVSRTYRYSTALPPAVCVATTEAIKLIQHETWRREKLHENIHFFVVQAQRYHVNIENHSLSPIKTIMIGKSQTVLIIQQKLQQQGFFISAIRPPTVPQHHAKLRISINAAHTKRQITQLLQLLKQCLREH